MFARDVLSGGIQRRQLELRAGFWDKDLVLRHMPSRCMMLGVADSPGMVRNPKSRMEDPANGVVNCLRFREGLVSALVRNDPEAGGYQSGTIAIECPEREPGKLVSVRVRVLDAGGGNQRLDGDGGLVDDGEQEEVPNYVDP